MAVPGRVVFGLEGDHPGLYHLRGRHNADSSVGLKMLGKYFPPWSVTRETWHAVQPPGVSGIATDIMLFHQPGRPLVHRYRIYKDPLSHVSLRGTVLRKLTMFAMAVAHLTSLICLFRCLSDLHTGPAGS